MLSVYSDSFFFHLIIKKRWDSDFVVLSSLRLIITELSIIIPIEEMSLVCQ